MLTNIFINVGFFISFSCGLFLSDDADNYESDESWKIVTAVPAFIGVISLLLAIVFFPEEPVGWYVANNRMEDAKRSLKSVYTINKIDKAAD